MKLSDFITGSGFRNGQDALEAANREAGRRLGVHLMQPQSAATISKGSRNQGMKWFKK